MSQYPSSAHTIQYGSKRIFFKVKIAASPPRSDHSMHTLPVFADAATGYDATVKRRSVVAGIALSLLLHGFLIFGYRSALLPAPAPVPVPNQAMTVWIQAPPRMQEEARQADAVRPQPAPPKNRKQERQPLKTQQADLRQEPAPALDMDAARRTARALANEPDPKLAPGTLAAQLDQHPLYQKSQETRLAREIGSAKRANCKDGVPGGLLAPLLLLMDKKDSGCKW